MSSNVTPNQYFTGIIYNPNNFNSNNNYLTLTVADSRYLQSTGNPLSTAINTTFQNQLTVSGSTSLMNTTITGIQNYGSSSYIDLNNCYFDGTNTTSLPSGTSTKPGLAILWNTSSGIGNTCFLNYGQGGSGGYTFYKVNSSQLPTLLLTIDSNGNIIPRGYLDLTGTSSIKTSAGLITNTLLGYSYGLTGNIQTQINNIISSTVLLSGSNAWTGTNTYNTYLPTSSLTPTSSNQLVTKSYCDTNFLTSSSLTTINSNISTLQTNTTGITYSSPNLSINENVIITGNLSFSNTASYIDMQNVYFYGSNSQFLPTGTSGKPGLGIFWNVAGYGITSFLNYSQGSVGGYNFYNTNISSPPNLLTSIDSNGNIVTNGYFDITNTIYNGINTTAGLLTNTVMSYLFGTTSNIQTQFNTLFTRTTGQNYNPSIATIEFSSNVYCTANLQNLSPTIYYYLSGITSNVQTQLTTNATNITSLQSSSMTISGVKTFSSNIILSNGLKVGSTSLTNSILQTLSDINTGTTIQTQISGLSTQVDNNTTNISTLQNKTTNQTYSTGTTTFSNNVLVTGNLQSLSNTIYSYLSNITSDVQTQFNNIITTITTTLFNTVNTWNVQQIFSDATIINSFQSARNIINSSSNSKIFCNPGTNIFSITLKPFYAKIITINIPISVYRNVTSSAVLTTRNETLNSISCNLYKNGSLVSSLSVSTNNSLGQLKRFDGSSATWTYEQFITNTTVSFTPTLENATNTYTIQYTMGQSYSSSASGETSISNGYYANTSESNYTVSGCTAIYASGSNYSATSYSFVTNTTLNSLMNGEIITNDVLTNNLFVNNVYPSYISPTSLPSLNTNIGYISSYVYSGSAFTFAGNNTLITSSNQITIPSGSYLISGYVTYYCAGSTQGNPYVNVNVCYYTSGSAGAVVPGCCCNQVYGANLLANRSQQLTCATIPLQISSTSTFCITWQINLNLTFTCSSYAITAIKIA